ncbi:helix-turn-helix transcriptional regulator [Vulcanisaeta distributa]|uniref:Transcriptional regulator, TrmB n=1 Tax=Vulcanisaeta distributa (strain DSM 14429 / JCM 11212 / NBRC 100878 / IC-017) TaxID=572478 RepID=E1QQJ3_VULDI|nr:helix-turn-helix domain-containing protein [Vulcanisaeta distributa]ADN50488.1 transcriptional regulator, TrmB [Vulcanisaeta distributa DSM 14429]
MVITPLMLIWIITLYSNGTSTVSLNTTLTGEFVTLQLPVQPQSYIEVLVNGSVTAYVINGTSIIIPVLGTANVSIVYVPRVFVENNFVGINVGNSTVEIVIPSNILIANITLSLINMSMVNNELLITARGPGEFLYTIMPMTKTTRVMTVTNHLINFEVLMVIIIAIIIIASTSYVLVIGRRKTTKGETTHQAALNLNDYELSILKYLKSRGGSAFEVDISRDLGIPRTTVWRSVRRLEGLGFVRITKVEGKNMVILIRDLQS